MDEAIILSLVKKSMIKHQTRKKWWQIRQVYKSYREIPGWSKCDSIRGILDWWWRLFPLSNWGRMTRTLNRLEKDIANNELDDIKKLFGLQCPLYSLAEVLKKTEVWISVKERLPKLGKQVFLIDSDTGYAYVGTMNRPKEWWFYNLNKEEQHPEKTITHWKLIRKP